MNELYSNYLEHHGILGQRWHHRNGPPYPLGAGDHSKSEKEAGYKKSLGGGRNEELYDRKAKKKEAKRVTKQLNRMDKDLAFEKRDVREALNKANRYAAKVRKKEDKGKEVSEKLRNKAKESEEHLRKEYEDVKRGEKEVNKILDSIDKSEFDVKSDDTIRFTNTGKDWAVAFLASAASKVGMGMLGAPFYFIYPPLNYEEGTKYKVKAKKKQQD